MKNRSEEDQCVDVKIVSSASREWDIDVSDPARENQVPSGHVAAEQHLPQMFPPLSAERVARARRFGTIERLKAGDAMYRTGEPSRGIRIVLRGTVHLDRRDGLGNIFFWMRLGEGHFVGEAGQLTGKPHLVDVYAVTDVEALLIPPDRLRALLIEEAQLGEQMMRALILRRVSLVQQGVGPVLIGSPASPKFIELEGFLRRVHHPYRIVDITTGIDLSGLLAAPQEINEQNPGVALVGGTVLIAPSEAELAASLGLLPELEGSRVYDVAVVGAGPAGLAAAVYAASEGLSVVVVDARGPGGQAGTSARIENYLGFPAGISGHSLSYRAFMQAIKFGAEIVVPAEVSELDCSSSPFELCLRVGGTIRSRTVVIATGASYRKPDIDGLDILDTRGVYFWASAIEARVCEHEEIALVGGGNSAGQAIVFLSSFARHIHVLIRKPDLEQSMSRYLIDRIAALDNVTVHTSTEIRSACVDADGLCGLNMVHADEQRFLETRHLFLFTGAEPNAQWLKECGVHVDGKGFVSTDRASGSTSECGHAAFETSVAGIFAIGDVRSSSIKRVAAAVGEGAAVVAEIHKFLVEARQAG
ncbi:FAD-dependent oxidoreductase [Paraburkholderia jirisanensis]